MRRIIPPLFLIVFAVLVWVCLLSPATAASEKGGSISGKVFFNTGNQNVPNGTIISLVNASNVSEYFTNITPDQNGFFQFTNVSFGYYRVYAWSPYYVEGYSAAVNVTSNDTYTASVVLLAMPYYANITASTQYVLYNSKSDITVQVADYWGRPVGSGWQILLRTTVGMMDPDSAYTDKDGKVFSKIAWVDNTTPAEITAFAISSNSSSYGLLENIVTVTPTPGANATPTATPSVTPTAVPDATATATPTVIPTATAVPTPTATPTPGFELIAGLLAIGLAISIQKRK
jgi:hypothetical protein